MSWTHCDTCGQPWQGHMTACKPSVADNNQFRIGARLADQCLAMQVPRCAGCDHLRLELGEARAANAELTRQVERRKGYMEANDDKINAQCAEITELRAALAARDKTIEELTRQVEELRDILARTVISANNNANLGMAACDALAARDKTIELAFAALDAWDACDLNVDRVVECLRLTAAARAAREELR